MNDYTQHTSTGAAATKFCKFCGEKIPMDAVVCVKCGRQVEELRGGGQGGNVPPVIVHNTNVNNAYYGRMRNKWAALILCFFLGYLGAHKFYEGKAGMGILYLFTVGLFGIGMLIDFIVLLFKPNPYYV